MFELLFRTRVLPVQRALRAICRIERFSRKGDSFSGELSFCFSTLLVELVMKDVTQMVYWKKISVMHFAIQTLCTIKPCRVLTNVLLAKWEVTKDATNAAIFSWSSCLRRSLTWLLDLNPFVVRSSFHQSTSAWGMLGRHTACYRSTRINTYAHISRPHFTSPEMASHVSCPSLLSFIEVRLQRLISAVFT